VYKITTKYTAEFLREVTPLGLRALLLGARQKLLELRSDAGIAGVRKPHLFKKVKKDIARIETVSREC